MVEKAGPQLKPPREATDGELMVSDQSRPRGTRFPALAFIAALIALALPAAAQGATFCVAKPGCVGTAQPGVQQALDAAAANGAGTPDRIEVGPGTYTNGNSTFTNVAGSPVTLVGSGNSTVLTATAGAPANKHVLTVSEPASRVTDLRVTIGFTNTAFGISLAGLAERVSITSPATVDAHTGVYMEPGSVFRNGEIELLGPTSGLSGTGANGAGIIEDSSIRALTGSAAGLTRRVRIRARTGVFAAVGTVTVEQALIELADTSPEGGGLMVRTFGMSGGINATNVTIIGKGGGNGLVAQAMPFLGPCTTTLNVSSSVVRGVNPAVARLSAEFGGNVGTANITIHHSSYDLTSVSSSGAGSIVATDGNIDDVPAGFAAATDYRPVHGSPLIDTGDPAAPPAGASSADAGGQPRVVDGDAASGARRDMGAFEYQRRAPTAQLAYTPSLPDPGQNVAFSAAGSSDPDGETLTYAWTFPGSPTPIGGQAVTRSFADAGYYFVTVAVTDAAGLTTTKSETVQVGNPGGPPPPPPPPPPAPPPSREPAGQRQPGRHEPGRIHRHRAVGPD